MVYTISELAQMATLSARTLRYYDEIGLLKPQALTAAGYRLYSEKEVDRLQQILLYREMGLPLEAIQKILDEPDFDRREALQRHLAHLEAEKSRLEKLMNNVLKSLQVEEGKAIMGDQEKYQGFKEQWAAENAVRFGEELEGRYGQAVITASRQKFAALSAQDYEAMENLAAQILNDLAQAVREGLSPESGQGQNIAARHKQWLSYTWPSYTPEAHAALAQMYVDDERFAQYYDEKHPGCAQFLCAAIAQYCR